MKQLSEQLQIDLMCLLESFGIEEAMDPSDYENLKNAVCDLVVSTLKKAQS